MSTTAKVELVRSVQAEFGLAPALAVLGLPRATWYYRAVQCAGYEDRHARLRAPLERIARQHPEYGYRRTTTELRERLGQPVNEKVVRRLHQCWGLLSSDTQSSALRRHPDSRTDPSSEPRFRLRLALRP